MEMLIGACDHSLRDCVVSISGTTKRVFEGGYVRGELREDVRREISALLGEFPGLFFFPGRYTLDIADHDCSHRSDLDAGLVNK